MSCIADKIKIAQDKDGMLRRALERIIQLYTDKSHFVYELLQNAEDAEATSIKFVQYPDWLEVMHDGKPFTAENLQGLCDIGKSDKVDNLNQIGEFGVGFKSVFGICDTVKLYSEPSNFRDKNIGSAVPFAVEILDFTSPTDIPASEIESSFTTKFVFPYTVGRPFSGFNSIAELNKVLSEKLQDLGITTLLFMKNLELIEYKICLTNQLVEGQYMLEKQTINDHCLLVSALGMSDKVGYSKEKTEEISYLKFSKYLDDVSQRTIDIAFPVVVKENGDYECKKPDKDRISVYFPTATESKLDFIVQGPFRTTPNRESIPADDKDNINLANKTSVLLREAILELKECGKFNMSFMKALPLSERSFDNYALFYPLYERVKALFMTNEIIPCKNGGYVPARCAKIARQERLATLFSDELLSDLINDGSNYKWLPTYLTETNKEYEVVYKYLTGELKVPLVRPENLRTFFAANPLFLQQQSDDWIIELYSILENVAAAFSKAKNEENLLTANIIKTTTGKFVAPYRKTENKQYIPNVFLPSDKIKSSDINFVDIRIYEKCRHFFDNILQLQKPNEYEFFITDIKKRYANGYVFEEERHIDDLLHLCKYLKFDEYKDEISGIIEDSFVIRCKDGSMRNTYMSRVFLPVTSSGLQIEEYLKNITENVFFVDMDFYSSYGISDTVLCTVGVEDSLLTNENVVSGLYDTGRPGRQPEWWTSGDFRWKLSMEYLKEAIKYISDHPSAKDSIMKSKTIFTVLMENESKLRGLVHIGGNTPNRDNEPSEFIRILRGEMNRLWNGKWLYTESLEVVSQKHISKHDLSTSIYGKVKSESLVYELLGFKKSESDEIDDLKKTIPQKQLEAYFENEFRLRFGISPSDLSEKLIESGASAYQVEEDEYIYAFPTAKIKNWDTLRKHAAEMLCFADPVKYDYAVRRIRVSNRDKEARAYLMNMYKYDGIYKYACQMCHDSCTNIEKTELFNSPETELDPMNLCLCPNCAAKYRKLRNEATEMEYFKNKILSLNELEIMNDDYISFDFGDCELWFTQIHIAEIQSLIKLATDAQSNDLEKPEVVEDEQEGLSVYSAYVGKKLRRKKDGYLGEVTSVDLEKDRLTVRTLNGDHAGKEMVISLSFVVQNPNIYQIL